MLRETVRYDIPRRVLRCAGCDLVRLDATDASIDYTGAEYRRAYSPIPGRSADARELFDTYRPFQEDRLRRVRHLLSSGQRLLDVGCSAGHFLDAVSECVGEVVGLELSQENADFVERELGFPVVRHPIEEAGLPAHSFDVVTAYQVLEHVTDPVPFLRAIGELLTPSGVAIIEVPGLDDALLSLYENDPYADFWFREVHAFYYDAATLRDMLARAGLSGEIRTVQQYNVLNHLHWLSAGTPQPHARVGMGAPHFPFAAGIESGLARELNAALEDFDRRYREILERHGHGENLLFIGSARAGDT